METHIRGLFENSGFIVDGIPDLKLIKKTKLSQIIAICEQSCDISSHEKVQFGKSIFSHTASSAIGADRHPRVGVKATLYTSGSMTGSGLNKYQLMMRRVTH
jgi:hypothetical protein